MWKTGHSLIKTKMKETIAPLAGEMSGHIFFAHQYYGFDDAQYAAIRLISAVHVLGGSLTALRDAMPAMVNTPEMRFQVSEERKFPVIEEVLANVLRANQRRISIDEIQTQVAEHYRIRKAEMTSARRAREVARPRQVAMYLSKQLTPKSLPDIGRRFGGRDHTTVIHAVKQIEKLRAADAELDADIRLLTRQLEG
jgi:chromosomal replication initiation ATPase DnaA